MSNTHTGNIQPALDYEEHLSIGGVNAKAVMVFDNAGNQITSFGGSGQATVAINSLVTLGESPAFIGLVTVANTVPTTFSGNVTLDDGSLTGIVGNVTLSDSKGFIGLVSVSGFANPMPVSGTFWQTTQPVSFSGNVTLDDGSLTGIVGNVTISDSKGFIGLVSVSGFANPLPVTFSGNVTLDSGSKTQIAGNVTLSDPKTFIGLTTTTLGASSAWIGLATVWARNAGTIKTLIHKNIELSTGSIATIAIAAEGNAIFNITQLLVNSNATVRVSIKSGATYLTGNASIGINLNPGGGWVENGSPDSPVYIGLASGAAIVAEKLDFGGVISTIGGKIIYFQE